ncbi:MAG: PAS domain S-box protein [Clostridiales bacterium]|nr:PAS domain S-box protein [Clostridiales bacterium]
MKKNYPDTDRAELLELVFRGNNEGIWDWNLETNEIYFSPRWKEQLGFADSELENKPDTIEMLLHPGDTDRYKSTLFGYLNSSSEVYSIQYRLKHKDGSFRWILSRGAALRDQNGKAYRLAGSHTDITDILKPYLENNNYQSIILDTLKDGHVFTEMASRRKDGSTLYVEAAASILSRSPFIRAFFLRDITERRNSEKKLFHYQELMRYIIEHNRNAVAVHDKNLNYMYVSQPYIELFNLHGKELIGRHHYEVLPSMPEDFKEVHRRVLRGEIIRSDETFSAFDAGKYVVWECRPWYEDDGSIGGFILYIEDITERKKFEQLMINEKEQLKTTLLSVGDGVISTDVRGNNVVMNPVAEKLTGWSISEAEGREINSVFRIIREQTRVPVEDFIMQILTQGKVIDYSNKLLISKTGNELPVEISVAPIVHSDGSVSGAVFIFRDVSEKRAEQRKIEFLSYNDVLTGLYNRRYIEDAMIDLDTPENLPITIFSVDVNGLKLANDAFGHEFGDQLLKTFADILKGVCQPEDVIGRVGGDEFCILMKNTDEDEAASIKERILDEMSKLKLYPIVASLAIGFAVKHSPEDDIKTVMVLSDHRMYQDKIKSRKTMRTQTIQMALDHNNLSHTHEQSHSYNVSLYCEAIARAMGFDEKSVQEIKTAGLLHDIGKIMISSHILNKSGKLSKDEFNLVKRHPEVGYQLLRTVDEYAHLSEFVLYHHECWDGSGYPIGLKGEKIPLFSRIIAVADAFDAMTGERPYQRTKTQSEAIEELKRGMGTQFDPEIVKIFCPLVGARV